MAVEMHKPSPKGKWEKVLDSSQFWFLPLALVTAGLLREELGFWFSLVIAACVAMGVTLLCRSRATAERTKRLENDARMGLFECALRYPGALPGSLRGIWASGYAEVTGGTLKFQTAFDLANQRLRSVTVLGDLQLLGERALSDRKLLASGQDRVLAVRTDRGEIELTAPPEILETIEERIRHGDGQGS